MGGLHGTISTTAFYAGDLIGFTTGLLITVLLLVLTLRAARLPVRRWSTSASRVCALLWCAGGLVRAALFRRRHVTPEPDRTGGPGHPVLRA